MLDGQKKKIVEDAISDVSKTSGGIAYCHFVEYKFSNSLEQPKRNEFVEYNIHGKTYLEAMQIWIEGLASLKEHDKFLKTNLFGKNFTEELYFSGNNRVSLHIEGKHNPGVSTPININVVKCQTPSGYEYYDITFVVNKLLPAKYTFKYSKGISRTSGDHGAFMKNVMDELSSMSGVLNFASGDFTDFNTEVTTKIGVIPELKDSEEALRMAILFTWPTTVTPQKSYIALIPPAFDISKKTGTKQITAGGVALFSNNSILLPSTSPLFDSLQNWVSVHTTKQLIEYSKNEATKSAKAAIMSRNMSHNIGSHVMSYLKQHLSSVTTIVNDNVLAEMITSSSYITAIQKDTPLPFLVGMGHFLSYLQERQDFIATIATDYIPYFTSINFKDFVYDELNPDKRFERHKDRKNLQPDNILLGNIARSEGLGRTIRTTSERSEQLSDIVLNFCSKEFTSPDGNEEDINTCIEIWNSNGYIFDGDPVVNSSNVTIAGREDAYKALEAMRKWEVSLPGGVIGRQAIFSIVENIIRNTAKHGNWRNQGKLELTFDFYDKDLFEKDFIKKFVQLKQKEAPLLKKLLEYQKKEKDGIEFSDSERAEYNQIKADYIQIRKELEPWNNDAAEIETSHHWYGRDKHNSLLEILYLFYSKSFDADDLYFVTITDNVNISESAVNKLREALIDPYIDDDSKMKEENKGIKEIRISAAWLRGAKNEDEYYNSGDLIEEPQTGLKAPLVYVRQHNKCLQYIICLQKPRKVAVITRKPPSEAAINALKERRWRYYSPEDYIKERNKSYRFTLCEDRDLYNMIRPFSSSRVHVLDRVDYWEKIKAGISEEDSKNLERHLYEALVSDKATIWIDDDKAKGVMPSKINEDKDYAVKVETDNTYYQVKDVDVRVIDGCHSHVDYTYRKHHDTLEQFTSFMEINPNGCQFVESITGDTSTDRLVRNEKYDFRWYYSHLNAMRKKVAIFDERLFSRIYGLEEADFTKGSVADLEELKKKYCEQKPIHKRGINGCNTFDALNKFLEEKKIPAISGSIGDVYTKDHIALAYYQKGICFYTLIKDSIEESSKKTSFGVYGLYFDRYDCSMPKHKDNYTCRCEKVATITWDGQTIGVDFDVSSKKNIENQFDFISIHQGLLDKLYEAFDIKYCKEKKIILTKTLHEKFGNNSSENIQEWEFGFVPGLIVHSGRSKPAENDMPQMLPFIQYASIEHAVLDCKYSLIDLLENARYEQ